MCWTAQWATCCTQIKFHLIFTVYVDVIWLISSLASIFVLVCSIISYCLRVQTLLCGVVATCCQTEVVLAIKVPQCHATVSELADNMTWYLRQHNFAIYEKSAFSWKWMQKSFSLYCKIVANFLLQLFEMMTVDSQAFIYAYLTMIKAIQIFSNKKNIYCTLLLLSCVQVRKTVNLWNVSCFSVECTTPVSLKQ